MTGRETSHLVECSKPASDVPAADDDLQLAANVDVPVLISGPPTASRNIACELDRRSQSPAGSVEVVDCRKRGALAALRLRTTKKRCDAARARILLLEEVHALSPVDQAVLARQLEAQQARSAAPVRILASSSVPLFERVVDQLFNERLFYRLNVIHIVVPLGRGSADPAAHDGLPL